jgi:hypothetical protein
MNRKHQFIIGFIAIGGIMLPIPIYELVNENHTSISQPGNVTSNPLQGTSPLQSAPFNGSLPFNTAMPIPNTGPFGTMDSSMMVEWSNDDYAWTDWEADFKNTVNELLAQPEITAEQLATVVASIPVNSPSSIIYTPPGNLPPVIYNPTNPTQQSPR